MNQIDKIMGQISAIKLKFGLNGLRAKVTLSHALPDEQAKLNEEIKECEQLLEVLEREIIYLQNNFKTSN